MTQDPIELRRGGWFVTGETWSGPWNTREAAERARDGDYDGAHVLHRQAGKVMAS